MRTGHTSGIHSEHGAREFEGDLVERQGLCDRVDRARAQEREFAQRRHAIVSESCAPRASIARDRLERVAGKLKREASIADAVFMRAFE